MSMEVNFETVVGDIKVLAETLTNSDGYVYYQISGIDLVRAHLYEDDLEIERFGYAMPINFPSSPVSAMLCHDDG